MVTEFLQIHYSCFMTLISGFLIPFLGFGVVLLDTPDIEIGFTE